MGGNTYPFLFFIPFKIHHSELSLLLVIFDF